MRKHRNVSLYGIRINETLQIGAVGNRTYRAAKDTHVAPLGLNEPINQWFPRFTHRAINSCRLAPLVITIEGSLRYL